MSRVLSQLSDLRRGLTERWPSLRIPALLASGAVISVVVAAPVLLFFGRAESAALYAAFAPLCHQVAERSWTVLGYPLAVCIRCFGFYCGVFGAFCTGAKFSRTGLWAAIIATFATVALEATSILAAPPGIRFLSGAWLGLAMASALSELVRAVEPLRRTHGSTAQRLNGSTYQRIHNPPAPLVR